MPGFLVSKLSLLGGSAGGVLRFVALSGEKYGVLESANWENAIPMCV